MQTQLGLFPSSVSRVVERSESFPQLLKWIGNKQRVAASIVAHFPGKYGRYFEPFLGSGAVLATLCPTDAIGSDTFAPLVGIWQTLHDDPVSLKQWYAERWQRVKQGDKKEVYEQIKAAYNASPNAADLLFLSRSCYGGVVRFRQADGYMSTPCGIHDPISPDSFSKRVDVWRKRTKGAQFVHAGYERVMALARPGDLIYCDPPYTHSQSILYGAQSFSLEELFDVIAHCKKKGVFVALSIDGHKRSGAVKLDLPIPDGLFEQELLIDVGRSMLRRFQMEGQTLEDEQVSDRLLLTW